jgi:hypothetical protein
VKITVNRGPRPCAPDAVAPGSEGNLWVDSVGGDLYVLVTNPMTVTPTKLSFSAPGQKKRFP